MNSKKSLKSLNSIERFRNQQSKERKIIKKRGKEKMLIGQVKSKDGFSREKLVRMQGQSRDFPSSRNKNQFKEHYDKLEEARRDLYGGKSKQSRVYGKYKNMSPNILKEPLPETFNSAINSFHQNQRILKLQNEFEINNAKLLKKSSNIKIQKKNLKSTIDRYQSKKFGFKEPTKKKGEKSKDHRKKHKGIWKAKKMLESELVFLDLARNPERFSMNKQKLDFKKKNKIDFAEQTKGMHQINFNQNVVKTRKERKMPKKQGRC